MKNKKKNTYEWFYLAFVAMAGFMVALQFIYLVKTY